MPQRNEGSLACAHALAGLPDVVRHLVPQDHADYTPADHAVWQEARFANERLVTQYADRIHPAYIEGLAALELPQRVPQVEELNERLQPTGWQTICVDGYLPTNVYVELIAAQILPLARSLRLLEHIDHAPAPDLIHDVFGHLPMLFSAEHRAYLRRLATVMGRATANHLDHEYYEAVVRSSALRANREGSLADWAEADERVERINRDLAQSSSELTHVRRIYVWSIEFGLLGSPDDFRVHGSALLSAPKEFRALCENTPRLLPYSLDVIEHENTFSDLLSGYFVARDFDELEDVLTEYSLSMQQQEPSATHRL